ncbi:MAG: hypothetical protein ACE5D7_01230 [Fidelibacterota bacterium]
MNLFSHSFKATSKLLTIIILLTFSFVNAQFISMSGHVHSVQINGVILPLAGAVVQIDGIDAQAASDSSGYYELSFLWNWNGPITAQCSAEGFETATETFFPESDNIVRNFTLYPIPDNMTHLQGHVRQMECDNCPIPGALISAFNINSPTDEIYSTYSGENGHYILPLPLTPDYGFIWSVTVQHPDFQSQTVELEIGPGGADHLFLLAPNDPAPTIGVYGYVSALSPNGMMIPVPGALITVWSVDISDEVYTTESGDNGYYELEFGPGEYTLTCTKNGFVPFETSFWVGNVPVHLPIILQPAPFEENLVFSGIVMGALGGMLPAYGPLSGAHVEVFGGDDPTFVSVDTYTDAEGHFSFFVDDSLHGFPVFQEALVRVSSPGFIMQEIWLNFYDWPVFHDFYLETIPSEDVFLSGTVFGPSSDDPSINLPLEGAHLRIYGGFSGGLLAEFITGDDGYYQFGDVVTAAYAIEIIAEGFISQEHSLPGYGGNYPMVLDFTLLPDENMLPYIAGHVYSADSADINIIIPGAFLQLRGFADDEIIEETLSDESGYYQFMVNGLFIDVSAFGYISQTVEVPQIDCGPANSRCWPIELDIYLQPDEVPPPTGIIFGMVSAQLSPMGPVFPVIGATVSAAPLWGGQEWISTETDNNGEYLLEVWAGDITWVVTCETEFGVHSEQVVVPPNEEVSVNFHFNVWEEPQIPAPFDLTAEPGINDSGNLVVFLNWQYPPEPDPDIQTEFHVFLIPPDNSDWIMVGGTLEHSFVFVLDGGPPNHPLCFAVRATSQGMVSEPSNVACAEFQEPDCFDLSDIDFGPCDMVLGAGWNGNECIWISGCSMESGGVDYSPYFFDSVEGCVDSCMDPPQNGTVFGWVTAQFSPEGPTVPIAGAVVQAVFPNGNDSLATVVTEENGHYAMTLPANNNGYLITCTTEYGVQTHMVSLPPGGEVQVDFHWNTWISDIPAPFDLIAEYDPNIPSWGGVVLQWQYPPMPDPTQVPVFHD